MMQSSKTLDLTETGTGHTGCGTFNALDAAALDYATEFLDDTSLLHFTQTSLSLRIRLLDDDTWLNKLTMLINMYPGVAHLEQGENEKAFSWYWRFRRALASAETMTRLHREGSRPYMLMHGTFTLSGTYVPCAPLRLPAPHGLIVEMMQYCKRLGMADSAYL